MPVRKWTAFLANKKLAVLLSKRTTPTAAVSWYKSNFNAFVQNTAFWGPEGILIRGIEHLSNFCFYVRNAVGAHRPSIQNYKLTCNTALSTFRTQKQKFDRRSAPLILMSRLFQRFQNILYIYVHDFMWQIPFHHEPNP